jgi:mRNA-degrading endonuclease RelE of RelBE toxin-antitoxin system
VPTVVPAGRKVAVYCVRDQVTDAQELYDDLVEHLEDAYEDEFSKVKMNKTLKKLRINGRDLRVMGLKTNKKGRVAKAGLKRIKRGDYVVILIDEVYQLEKVDYLALLEATADSESVIVIKTSNPQTKSNWFVAECSKNLKHDLRALRSEETKGQQFKTTHDYITLFKGTQKEREVPSTRIFHYTN